ncbi:ATP-binding protein [Streptomyces sp. SID12501]|uniref:histidine kinase n=1 Tax=Streptomyces sp. SID12501 TaxID=2706042 RepID=A0A6B3BG34_9ACTN|nr:HAMP domain-containing protein [Streptomyces sp. SID12501]
MSTKEVDASARPASPASSAQRSTRRGLRGFADRWPFQRKLNVLVGIPLTVIALLLTYLIVDLVQESNRAEDAAQLVRASAQVARLVAELQAEHQQALLLSVRYEAAFDAGTPSTAYYRQAQSAVDAQVRTVVDAFGDRLPDTEVQALKDVQALSALRATIEQGYLPATNIDPAYSGAADGLIDGLGLDRNADLATTFTGNLLDSLLRAGTAHGAYETGVFSAGTRDSNALIEFTGAVGSYELFTYQAERFARFADEAQTDEFGGIEHNSWQAAISRQYAELAVDPSALQAESKSAIQAALRTAIISYPNYRAQSGTRLDISTSLIDQIADRADDAASSAQWRAGLLLNLALLCFALWIAFSILVRRSVVRPVLALTGAAQEVADVAGRELARVADDDAEESGSPRLRRLPVTADDEIGELARAFNNVQTTAAALLERQVHSRRNVAEMFGNVGRRVSNLTTRQLALIDAVERGETDPALLERLYSIDHIAVRLRRNADSLMLLAGIRETVLGSGPTALTNVVRAALGQIEGFQRVRLRAATEAMVEPDIIGDLTLMIAELLENAVSFSPEDSPVEVVVGSDHESASITVADHGLGMSAERLAEENSRLVRRERLDVVPTKVLGLFVVGALARRWDVDVTLSRTPGGGVTAEVMIPSTLLLTMSELEPTGRLASRDVPPPPSALTSPSAPAAGPSPSSSIPSTVPSWATHEDDATVLPRRVPRRDASPAEQETGAPLPSASTAEDPTNPARDTATTTAGASSGSSGHSAEPVLPSRTTRSAPLGLPTRSGSLAANAAAESGSSASLSASAPRAGLPEPASGVHPDGTGIPAPRTAEPTLHTRAKDGPGAYSRTTERMTPAAATEPSPYAYPTGPQPTARTTEQSPHGHPAEPQPTARTSEPSPYAYPAGPESGPARAAGGPGDSVRGAEQGAAGHAADPFAVGPDGSRPLRRRVRGATLRTPVDAGAQQAARQAARPADADAVRDSLEEFEAAVARAHRDTGEHPRPTEDRAARRDDGRHDHRPHVSPDRTESSDPSTDQITVGDTTHDQNHQIHQNHLPEGAEQ